MSSSGVKGEPPPSHLSPSGSSRLGVEAVAYDCLEELPESDIAIKKVQTSGSTAYPHRPQVLSSGSFKHRLCTQQQPLNNDFGDYGAGILSHVVDLFD